MVRCVSRMLRDATLVDEVVQDTFVRLHRALGSFRGEASLSTWLLRIAINRSCTVLKQQRSWRARFFSRDDHTDTSVAEPALDPGDPAERDERVRAVHAAVARLDPAMRAIVVMRLLEGYSTKEVASVLNIPEGTVMSRLSRATQRLAGWLAPFAPETSREA